MSKKIHCFSAALLLLLVTAGCVFTPYAKHESSQYDLQVSAAAEPQHLFTIVSVCNSTPAGSKFFYRFNTNQIQTDPYRNWVQSPETMLQRYFMKRFPAGGKNANPIEVKLEIITFEFDQKSSEAVVAYNYLLRKSEARQRGVISLRKKYLPTADSMVAAMNDAVEESSIQLWQNIKNFAGTK